jgi:hypothetical protein
MTEILQKNKKNDQTCNFEKKKKRESKFWWLKPSQKDPIFYLNFVGFMDVWTLAKSSSILKDKTVCGGNKYSLRFYI